jgi:hypothetical protein
MHIAQIAWVPETICTPAHLGAQPELLYQYGVSTRAVEDLESSREIQEVFSDSDVAWLAELPLTGTLRYLPVLIGKRAS